MQLTGNTDAPISGASSGGEAARTRPDWVAETADRIRQSVESVIEAATRILGREAEMIRRIEAGESASVVLGANYEHMLEKKHP